MSLNAAEDGQRRLLLEFVRFVNSKNWEALSIQEVHQFFGEYDNTPQCEKGRQFLTFVQARGHTTYQSFLSLSPSAQASLECTYFWSLLAHARALNRCCNKQLFLATIFQDFCGQSARGRTLSFQMGVGLPKSTYYQMRKPFTAYCREKTYQLLASEATKVFWFDNMVKKWKRNHKLNVDEEGAEVAAPYPIRKATVLGANLAVVARTPSPSQHLPVRTEGPGYLSKTVFSSAVKARVVALVDPTRTSFHTTEVGLSVSVTPTDLYEESTSSPSDGKFSTESFLPLAVIKTRPDTLLGTLETLAYIHQKKLNINEKPGNPFILFHIQLLFSREASYKNLFFQHCIYICSAQLRETTLPVIKQFSGAIP